MESHIYKELIQIALCDDQPAFIEAFSQLLVSYLEREKLLFSLTVFQDGESLLESDIHFDIILSNALDNAVEACAKVKDGSVGKIFVSSYIKQNFLVLDVSNTVFEPVKIVYNSIESTKLDKHLHGIGLYNIEAAVLRCGGNMKLSASDESFTLSIVLPM